MDQELDIKLTKTLASIAKTIGRDEARYLCSLYINAQKMRKSSDQKVAKIMENAPGELHAVLSWASDNYFKLERQILRALHMYAEEQPMGKWALGVEGCGPVVASGLLSHIDIEEAPTPSHIWAFAGLDPTKVWKKGQKRPHNAQLKQICYYLGQSFMKLSGLDESGKPKHPGCPYARVYREYKARITEKNDRGGFSERAKQIASNASSEYKKTSSYKENVAGKLSKGHIDKMARRKAVKDFLVDWHMVAYRLHYKKDPPIPYPEAILHHAHVRHEPLTQ